MACNAKLFLLILPALLLLWGLESIITKRVRIAIAYSFEFVLLEGKAAVVAGATMVTIAILVSILILSI